MQPSDELASTREHRSDEQLDRAVRRSRRTEQRRGRGRDVVLARQTEAHETPFGLVRDRLPAELEHDGEPDLGGGEHAHLPPSGTVRSAGTGMP